MSDIHYKRVVVVTGGAGFIGSNFLLTLVPEYPEYLFLNVDALTYAGSLANLKEIEHVHNYRFERVDISKIEEVQALFQKYKITDVVHFAAESHVDRSILGPLPFVYTNVVGTVNLLQTAYEAWKGDVSNKRFFHVSTDEVYGSLASDEPTFAESNRYDPHSPYSASKASADHFVRAYHDTFGMPTLISNCSNNYGPFQFPEKLIPLVIRNIIDQKPIPVYGDGSQVRDWLYVLDHVRAIERILIKGKPGETYNIGGNNELKNIDLVKLLIKSVDSIIGYPEGHSLGLITYVADRPGHDTRYAIDARKISRQLGWQPSVSVEEGIQRTVSWYLKHQDWLEYMTSGEYQSYYEQQYGNRGNRQK